MEIRMNVEVSLQEAENLILAVGNQNAIHLVGEPGIGKTAMYERLVAKTGYRGVYIDTPNTELGDIGIPMPNHETKTTSLYPNEIWGFHTGEPCVVFIDEFTKPSSQAVQNMLHPLLNERRIGGMRLHKDSIVITAGNNLTDGVGDMLKAHSLNRMTVVPVRKPTWEEYVDYGTSVGYAPEMLAFVRQYPQVMASYKDPAQSENYHIFNPKTPQKSYFSPRSGHRASNVLKIRHLISRDALLAALCGTIGEASARDLLAYVEVADSLPSWDEVIADPEEHEGSDQRGGALHHGVRCGAEGGAWQHQRVVRVFEADTERVAVCVLCYHKQKRGQEEHPDDEPCVYQLDA